MAQTIAEDKFSQVYRKTIEQSICFLCHWELTYECNLRCRHCYCSRDERKREFTFEKAKAMLDELKRMGCLYLILSGGEILARKDFFEIAHYARTLGFALRLLTNGTLIDEKNCAQIAALYPLSVEMSIYSSTYQLHDKITRVRGSFMRTVHAARLLKRHGLRVVLKLLIMEDNARDFRAVEDLTKRVGADFFYDFAVAKKDDGSSLPLRYRLSREKIRELYEKNRIPLERDPAGSHALTCSAGMNNLFINPYLQVYPCIGLKINLGNLYTQGISDIWKNNAALKRVREVRDDDLPQCNACGLKTYCSRCPGIAYSEDGDFLGPSGFDCAVAQIRKTVIAQRGG